MLHSNLSNLGEKDKEHSSEWLVHTDPEIVANQENRSIRTNYYFFLQIENKPIIRNDKKTELILRRFMKTFIALEERKKNILKTLLEKEKMLVTSIFFFSHNVSYPITYNFNVFSNISLCRLQMFSIWTWRKFCRLIKRARP